MADDDSGRINDLLALDDRVLAKLINPDITLPQDPETRLPLVYLLRQMIKSKGFAWTRQNWRRVEWLHAESHPEPTRPVPPVARPREPGPLPVDDAKPALGPESLPGARPAPAEPIAPAGPVPVASTPGRLFGPRTDGLPPGPGPRPPKPGRPAPTERTWRAFAGIDSEPAVCRPLDLLESDLETERRKPEPDARARPAGTAEPAAEEPDTEAPATYRAAPKRKPVAKPEFDPVEELLSRPPTRPLLNPRRISRRPELNPPEP